ncbi:hypothetical protein, partial [Henriciella sp.]
MIGPSGSGKSTLAFNV